MRDRKELNHTGCTTKFRVYQTSFVYLNTQSLVAIESKSDAELIGAQI